MTRYKPEFDNEDAHERNKRIVAETPEPVVCPKCLGIGKLRYVALCNVDEPFYKECYHCEGEGVVYE